MKYRALAFFCVSACIAIAGFVYSDQNKTPVESIRTALQSCIAGRDSDVIDSCLKTNVRSLLSQNAAATLMHYIVASSTQSSIVSQCHVIAHVIGEESLIAQGSLEAALARCTNECNYGCIHGAVAAEVARSFGETYPGEDIAHADTKEIEALGKKYCERSQALCHGIGHIARIASDTLVEALKTCASVAPPAFRYSCNNGVFMEDFGRIAFVRRDAALDHPDDYGYPCNSVPDEYASDCYYQLRDYQRARFDANDVPAEERLTISKNICADLTGSRRHDCFAGLGYKLDRDVDANGQLPHNGPALCDSLANTDRTACMTGLAFNYASFSRINDAVAYCDTQTERGNRSICYDTVFRNVTIARSALASICTTTGSTVCREELRRFEQEH